MVEVTVPDPAVRTGRQLSACWGPGNSLLLHGGEETKVHELKN